MNRIVVLSAIIVAVVVALGAIFYSQYNSQSVAEVTAPGKPASTSVDKAAAPTPAPEPSGAIANATPVKVKPVNSTPVKVVKGEPTIVPSGTIEGANMQVAASENQSPSLLMTQASSGSKFQAELFTGHALGFGEDTRSFTEFLVEAKYQVNAQSTVGIGQDARKLYLIEASGEDEFLLGDTRLFYQRSLSPNYGGIKWDLELGTSLPVSKQSRETKHITQPSVSLKAEKSLLNNRVKVALSPSFSYRFNQYATDDNGRPLEKMVLAQEASIDFQIAKRLNLVTWAKGYYRIFEQFDFSNTSPGAETSFGLGAALGYRVTDFMALQAGVVRGTSILRDVRYDSQSYDPERNRYFFAVRFDI